MCFAYRISSYLKLVIYLIPKPYEKIFNASTLQRFNASTLLRFSLILICAIASFSFQAQTATQWKVDGNNVTTDSKLGTNSGYDLIIETANNERMRVTDAGYVGIGVATPETKLHLIGDFKILGNIRLGNWENANATESSYTYVDGDGILKSASSNKMLQDFYREDCKIFPDAIYPAPTWASFGDENFGVLYTATVCPSRVGIGTNAPASLLDVAGSTSSTRLFIGDRNSIDNDYQMRVSGLIQPATYGSIMDLKNHGAVKFSFFGNEDDPFMVYNGNDETPFFKIHQSGTIDMNYFGGSGIVFKAHDFFQNKDIAILTDDGKWWCQGVVVRTVPFWGDFVFNENYQRLSLFEIEKFIQENHHLPGIPSAVEVEECGIDVTDMLRILTIKIEELTLHAIDQQKEIERLKALSITTESSKN